MLANKDIQQEQKSELISNIMNSAASDKHKFNSGLVLMEAEPKQSKQTIDKLYQGVKDEQNKMESYNLGVAGYMIKPVDYLKFVEVIKTINLYWTLSESVNINK